MTMDTPKHITITCSSDLDGIEDFIDALGSTEAVKSLEVESRDVRLNVVWDGPVSSFRGLSSKYIDGSKTTFEMD